MSWFGVILLALVEGITEFLPISSTGHMILAGSLWNMPQTDFMKSFEIIVQLGAILAVLVTYWKILWNRKDYWPKIITSLIPTLAIAYFLYPLEKKYLMDNVWYTIAGLVIGAVAIIIVERQYKIKPQSGTTESLTLKQAALIGIAQTIAIFPGVSRSAATVLTGMALGQSRESALQFSFLLALPVMAAATGLDVLKNGFSFTSVELMQLALGLSIAFVVALVSVKWLIRFVQQKSLMPFAWYRLLLVVVFTSLWALFR